MSPSRRMALKYSGNCIRCGSYLSVGTQAFWDTTTKKVHCISCPKDPILRQTKRNQENSNSSNFQSNFKNHYQKNVEIDESKILAENIEWFRYCNFLADCVYAESQIEPPGVKESSRLKVIEEFDVNSILNKAELSDEHKRYLERIDSGRSVIVGWPILCIEGKEGNRIIPIFQFDIILILQLCSK